MRVEDIIETLPQVGEDIVVLGFRVGDLTTEEILNTAAVLYNDRASLLGMPPTGQIIASCICGKPVRPFGRAGAKKVLYQAIEREKKTRQHYGSPALSSQHAA